MFCHLNKNQFARVSIRCSVRWIRWAFNDLFNNSETLDSWSWWSFVSLRPGFPTFKLYESFDFIVTSSLECGWRVWLSESGTFYRSFQFPLHGNYQLVFSRLPTTKNLLKRKIFKQRRFFRTFKYKRMIWYRDFSQIPAWNKNLGDTFKINPTKYKIFYLKKRGPWVNLHLHSSKQYSKHDK